MGVHWLRYDIGIAGKVGRNTFVVTVRVNYMEYVETNTSKYRVFSALIRQTYFIRTLATDIQMLWLLLNYVLTVAFAIKTLPSVMRS
jgi:hypothetical protein